MLKLIGRFFSPCLPSIGGHCPTAIVAVLLCLAPPLIVSAQTELPTLDQALEISRAQGIPILAMAGYKT